MTQILQGPSAITAVSRATPSRLISLADVCERIGRSRWWLRRALLEDRFPKPVSTGSRFPLWIEAEIETWIASLAAARDGGKRS